MMPSVSVIMSIYNEKNEWIHESINSILNQTFSNFEFIIINDNPNRVENDEILNFYKNKDSRIILIKNVCNIGLTKSLNIGLKMAKGEYIARMDADDISLSKRIERQIDYMEAHPECIICGTFVSFFGKDSQLRQSDFLKQDSVDIKSMLFTSSCFAHPSVVIRHDALKENNISYDEEFIAAQDYKMWIDLKDKGEFYNIPEVLLQYRVSTSQVSSKKSSYQQQMAIKLRRNLIIDYISNLTNDTTFEIPAEIDLSFVRNIYLIEKNISKRNKQDFTYILLSCLLSISKINASSMLFLGKILLFRGGFSFKDTLRILERIVFPNKKFARL